MATLEPTFLVKKSDGTTVRMTMAEFDAWKKQQPNTPALKESTEEIIPVAAPQKSNTLNNKQVVEFSSVEMKNDTPKTIAGIKNEESRIKNVEKSGAVLVLSKESVALSTTTPVRDVFIDEAAAAVHPIANDHHSPLEEDLDAHITQVSLPRLPADNKDAFAATLVDLPFPIDASLRGRAVSLMQSRAKDIRSDDQFILYATKPALDGGLGLDESQAHAMLGALATHAHLAKPVDIPPALPLKQKRASVLAKEQTPMSESRPSAPSSSAPASSRPFSARPTMHDVVPASAPGIDSSEPLQAVTPDISARDLGTTVSPVEELQSMRIEDFRRLGKIVPDRGAAVSHKFDMLRSEAFALYIDASRAWRQSPLFAAYADLLSESVRDGKTVADTITAHADSGALTVEEFAAIAKINAAAL